MRLALCQLDIVWEDKGANLEKVAAFARRAAAAQVELLLFPEMTLTGFSMCTERSAESHRESLERVRALAVEHAIAIGFGWVEAGAQGRARNHYSVLSKDGSLLSDYVKIHPFSYGGEDALFQPGEELSFFTLGYFRAATFICYDLRFPEVFQAASREAGLIIVAANWPAPRSEHWRTLLKARAIENQSFVAGVNCVGEKGGQCYSGDSMVLAPDGTVVGELTAAADLLVVELSPERVAEYREAFPVKRDRKTEFYRRIL